MIERSEGGPTWMRGVGADQIGWEGLDKKQIGRRTQKEEQDGRRGLRERRMDGEDCGRNRIY